MSQYLSIPVHATIERRDSAIVPADHPIRAGKTIVFALWRGMASDGHATGYSARPARWLEVYIEGDRKARCASRYTGRNYAKGLEHYVQNLNNFAKDYPGASASFPCPCVAAVA